MIKFEVNADLVLVKFTTKQEVNSFFEEIGCDDCLVSSNEMAEAIAYNTGFYGWIIPNNFPGEADIMIVNSANLTYLETIPVD